MSDLLRRAFAGAAITALLAGCFTLVDFEGFDTSPGPAPDPIVIGEAGTLEPFTMTLSPLQIALQLNVQQKATLTVQVTRTPGFDGDISVSPQGLPDGVRMPAATLSKDQTSVAVTLEATVTIPPTKITLVASSGNARLERPFDLVVLPPPGTLDTSFGIGGVADLTRVTLPSTAFDPAGNLVVLDDQRYSGVPRLKRFRTDAGLDPTFGDAGAVGLAVSKSDWRLATPDDAGLVLAGNVASLKLDVVRFSGDGVDAGWMQTTLSTDLGVQEAPFFRPVAASDGAGAFAAFRRTAVPADAGQVLHALRFSDAGTTDGGFAFDGSAVSMAPQSMRTAAGGVLIVGLIAAYDGSAYQNTLFKDFAMVRALPSGAFDSTFGTGGLALAAFPSSGATNMSLGDVLFENDGALVVGSIGDEGGAKRQIALARFRLADGKLDTAFGDGGRVVIDLPNASTTGFSAFREVDGRILVVGDYATDGLASGLLLRLQSDGKPDATFRTDPLPFGVRFHVPGKETQLTSVRREGDRIVVAGVTRDTNGSALVMLRFIP